MNSGHLGEGPALGGTTTPISTPIQGFAREHVHQFSGKLYLAASHAAAVNTGLIAVSSAVVGGVPVGGSPKVGIPTVPPSQFSFQA